MKNGKFGRNPVEARPLGFFTIESMEDTENSGLLLFWSACSEKNSVGINAESCRAK
jgi:hypothetical protein